MGLTWGELESFELTWGEIEALNLTWGQWEEMNIDELTERLREKRELLSKIPSNNIVPEPQASIIRKTYLQIGDTIICDMPKEEPLKNQIILKFVDAFLDITTDYAKNPDKLITLATVIKVLLSSLGWF